MNGKKKYKRLELSDIGIAKKGDRVELEGIAKGIVNYQGILRKTFSGFLIDKEDLIPIFGTCYFATEATLKRRMLNYSEETDTVVTIRGIIKENAYIKRQTTLLGVMLKVKAISSKEYEIALGGCIGGWAEELPF